MRRHVLSALALSTMLASPAFAIDFASPESDRRARIEFEIGVDLVQHQKFDDAFTFIFEETEHGWIWAHAYQFEADTATFIVECSEATWRRFGFDTMNQEETLASCERIFAKHLGGHQLATNAKHLTGSVWLNFRRVLCDLFGKDMEAGDFLDRDAGAIRNS